LGRVARLASDRAALYGWEPMSLIDAKGRRITYLRLSLTDRCNYRCTYCMPKEGYPRAAREELLDIEELVRVVAVFAGLGVTAVRLTGGEPSVRGGLVDLVAGVAGLPGIDDVAMTTNGDRLATLALPLREAGLRRLNVSLDTLDPIRFGRMTRGGRLEKVLSGLDAAAGAGFEQIKINTVVIGGENDHEIEALCEYAWARGILPRFIELMPIGEAGRHYGREAVVPTAELVRRLDALIEAEPTGDRLGPGPAVYYRHRARPEWRVGFIGAVTEQFCATCNRLRLTSQGALRGCLARPEGVDLRNLIRSGATDTDLAAAIRLAVFGRKEGHEFWTDAPGDTSNLVVMTGVGG
jgi:GTP 3',8-cyclase